MRHFKFAEKIRENLQIGIIGEPLYITYHVGQYLPDWHPWEDIKDFYVSNPSTAACKEIVPFELTWLCEILDDYEPEVLTSVISRTGQIDAPIDDLYNAVFRSASGCLLNLTIEILSRPSATRKFHLVGTNGTITYDALTKEITTETAQPRNLDVLDMTVKPVDGYIYSDQPYEKEMAAFFSAILKTDKKLFPNDLDRDSKVLKLLQLIEEKAVKIG
jgi:predicted dehydrogenase